ncbi:MAG: MerR family transcriptional regulator [Flavobacteriales bacterium]|nr:MerR family transcriptional regulator [Flavobacteriales bacterium]
MPLKPKTIEKIYWTIGEVAAELGVKNSSIRFWEKEIGTVNPKRTGKGDRLYNRKEIDQLKTIQHLLKDKGFTLSGAKNELRHSGRTEARTLDLEQLRQRLLTIRRELIALKIQHGGSK